ncbi:hypothetical protein DDE74_01720 [Streptomyces lydicus]|uniref:Uncharacterized protein n=1 Tax=Streptomyces lydicus TaxID=47763 RepID=A0A3Q9K6T2_9ACTN|nr:hypothetical protein DDE74_01720 [Streptomyces lydicus]
MRSEVSVTTPWRRPRYQSSSRLAAVIAIWARRKAARQTARISAGTTPGQTRWVVADSPTFRATSVPPAVPTSRR